MSTATGTATGDGVPGMFMAKVGQPAPDFNLPSTKNLETLKDNVKLADYKGKWLILLFYPLDFTALCPTELTAFSDRLEEVQGLGAEGSAFRPTRFIRTAHGSKRLVRRTASRV